MLRDFPKSGIKSPFERMRANAIINAKCDAAGYSMINFNITTFLPAERHSDAFMILSLWAIEPIRLAREKFMSHAEEGNKALRARTLHLLENLSKRNDIPSAFIIRAREHMFKTIESELDITPEKQTTHHDVINL